MWHNGKQQKEWLAHGDIIRGITEVPNIGFATCSNDEVVKIWTMDGQHIQDLRGHNGFVFCIDTLNTGEIVTGGDDCCVKVWQPMDGSLTQTI